MKNIMTSLVFILSAFNFQASVIDINEYSEIDSAKVNEIIQTINKEIVNVDNKKDPSFKNVLKNFVQLGKDLDASALPESEKQSLKLNLNKHYKEFKKDPSTYITSSAVNENSRNIPSNMGMIFLITFLTGIFLFYFLRRIFKKELDFEEYMKLYMEGGHIKLPTIVFDLSENAIVYKNQSFEGIFSSKTEDDFLRKVSLFLKKNNEIEGEKVQLRMNNEDFMVTRKEVEFKSRKFRIIHLIGFDGQSNKILSEQSDSSKLQESGAYSIDAMMEKFFAQNSFLFQLKGVLVHYDTDIGSKDISLRFKEVYNCLNTMVCGVLKLSERKNLKNLKIICSQENNDLSIEFAFNSRTIVDGFKNNEKNVLNEMNKGFNLAGKFKPRFLIGKNHGAVVLKFPLLFNPRKTGVKKKKSKVTRSEVGA